MSLHLPEILSFKPYKFKCTMEERNIIAGVILLLPELLISQPSHLTDLFIVQRYYFKRLSPRPEYYQANKPVSLKFLPEELYAFYFILQKIDYTRIENYSAHPIINRLSNEISHEINNRNFYHRFNP